MPIVADSWKLPRTTLAARACIKTEMEPFGKELICSIPCQQPFGIHPIKVTADSDLYRVVANQSLQREHVQYHLFVL